MGFAYGATGANAPQKYLFRVFLLYLVTIKKA
jgi:hypothetical protein